MTNVGNWLLATDPEEGKLRVFDTSNRLESFTVDVGGAPEMVAATPDGSMAFTVDRASGEVSAVDLRQRKVVNSAQAGPGGHYLAVSPTGQQVVVSRENSPGLMRLNAATGMCSAQWMRAARRGAQPSPPPAMSSTRLRAMRRRSE